MPATIFPTWPHLVFAVFEPITLIGGWLAPIFDLQGFVLDQIPSSPVPKELEIHATSFALAYQLANLYGLMALLGAGVFYATSEPNVLRNYLGALAIADVGHIYVTYLAMGPGLFFDVAKWNALTWGNVGVTGFLFVNRLLYFLGVFGYAQGVPVEKQKKRV
ncbi:uncharacterized protein DSM5745_02853 [Aspergillus mulundensis]|uniref:DUF7704 domain-containing protein n=1 Tax=Aspergillus mulundensis TaxID=1810919 RepID=A0A3D8SJ61_9EURO|nr:Uncharacterized protein DSM5745_02853 [Aspergillus mulundensis]RDW86211.1 Uncharacterized protein DSM5745_02853 [Aspergillus mulundensis]